MIPSKGRSHSEWQREVVEPGPDDWMTVRAVAIHSMTVDIRICDPCAKARIKAFQIAGRDDAFEVVSRKKLGFFVEDPKEGNRSSRGSGLKAAI